MNNPEGELHEEAHALRLERDGYSGIDPSALFFFNSLSTIFLSLGFLSLFLMFFTAITFLDATCLFVISFVLSPSDGERNWALTKGMAEDLAQVRMNIETIRKTDSIMRED